MNLLMESEVKNMQRNYIKKTDIQKQERIEQLLADLNKYKKIDYDKELNTLQLKYTELEKGLSLKINDLTHQRDDLKKNRMMN